MQFLSKMLNIFSFTLLPFIYFLLSYLKNIKNYTLLNFFFFWKTANYADAYWFLYSNKKILLDQRYL